MSSIQSQLRVRLIVFIVLVMVVSGVVLYQAVRWALVSQLDNALYTKANALIALTEWEAGVFEFEPLKKDQQGQVVNTFFTEKHFYYRFQSVAGEILIESDSAKGLVISKGKVVDTGGIGIDLTHGENRAKLRAVVIIYTPKVETEDEHDEEDGVVDGNEKLEGGIELQKSEEGGVVPEEVVLIAAIDSGELNATLSQILVYFMVTGVIVLIVIVVIAGKTVRYGLSGLKQLSGEVQGIHAFGLDKRFDVVGVPAELKPIVEGLNRMLCQLEMAFDREREFTANIAHELRTPLAEMGAMLDVAIKWPEEKEKMLETIVDARAVSRKMGELVDVLFGLIRQSGTLSHERKVEIPLRGMVDGCMTRFEAVIKERMLTVKNLIGDDVVLNVRRGIIEMVVENLISNASRYAKQGGVIEISCKAHQLCVGNSVEGLSADDVGDMFDAFWRKDEVRTSGGGDEFHAGIGLSLVKKLLLQAGGDIRAELVRGDWLVICVDFE